MRFSLVMCTVGRRDEIGGFIESLLRQNRQDYELIIVDQNADRRLDEVIARYADRCPITHIRSDAHGASRARNVGLNHATGEIVCFPDDDCEYLDRYLDYVDALFASDPQLGAIAGYLTADPKLELAADFRAGGVAVTKMTVPHQSQEFTICIRRSAAPSVRFNPLLGVGCGTPWGSDEGPDFLLRIMNAGVKVEYYPQLVVYHPDKTGRITAATLDRAASYARGRGCFYRLHNYPLRVVARSMVRPLIGCALYLVLLQWMRSRYYWAVVSGLCGGMLIDKAELARVAEHGNSVLSDNVPIGGVHAHV